MFLTIWLPSSVKRFPHAPTYFSYRSEHVLTAISMNVLFINPTSLFRSASSLTDVLLNTCAQKSQFLEKREFGIWGFSAGIVSRNFLPLTPHLQERGWGCTRSWGEHSWNSLALLTTPCGHHVAYKAERRRKKGDYLEWWHLSAQVTVNHTETLFSMWWLNTCLLMGSSGWILCSTLLYLLVCLYLNVHVFLLLLSHAFTLLILSSIPWEGIEWVCGAAYLS